MSLSINKFFEFKEYEAPIYSLESLGNDAFFAGGGDKVVTFRNASENSLPHAIVNTGTTIYSLKYVQELKVLLIGVAGGGMHVIDLEKKKEIHFLVNHQKGIFDIKYSTKHKKIFTAGGDGKLSIWSSDGFTFIKSLTLCNEKVRAVIFDREENDAWVACGDGTIRVISIEKEEEKYKFNAHDGSVNALCLHPKADVLISGGKDAHLNIWSTNNFQLIRSIPAHNYAIYSICFSPNSSIFATASRDKMIKIWDGNDYAILSRINHEKNAGHFHSVNKIVWINAGLVSASDDKKIIGWDIHFNN